MANLQFRKFVREDFPEYQSWYADADLNEQLGPMETDDEWLYYVLSEWNGIEYSVFRDGALVAVLGIVFPDDEHPSYYITDLAVKPGLRRQGIGTEALKTLFALHPLKAGQMWKTYVAAKNPRVRVLLERSGWICETETPSESGMLPYSYCGDLAYGKALSLVPCH